MLGFISKGAASPWRRDEITAYNDDIRLPRARTHAQYLGSSIDPGLDWQYLEDSSDVTNMLKKNVYHMLENNKRFSKTRERIIPFYTYTNEYRYKPKTTLTRKPAVLHEYSPWNTNPSDYRHRFIPKAA